MEEIAFPYHIEERLIVQDGAPWGTGRDTVLLFVLGGSALHRVGAEEMLLRRGDILILGANGEGSFFQPRDFRVCAVRCRMDALLPPTADIRAAAGFQALFQGPGKRCTLHPDGDVFLRLEAGLKSALEEYRLKRPGYQTWLQGHWALTAAQLARLWEEKRAPVTENGVALALAYIEDHYAEEIALPELARIAGISPRHFDRLFQAQCLMPPRAYITRLRLARARALLGTDRPITEIAFDCGYADSNYFARVFRKACGMSPQQYRQKMKGQ